MRYPQFLVMLNLARGGHSGDFTQVGLSFTGDEGDMEWRLIYEALRAGQYEIEGGYPCMDNCGSRHPPLMIARIDGTEKAVTTVWPVAA